MFGVVCMLLVLCCRGVFLEQGWYGLFWCKEFVVVYVYQFQCMVVILGYVGQWVVGYLYVQVGFFGDQMVQVVQQGVIISQYDVVFGDVGVQFWWGLFQCQFDCVDDV